MSDFSPNRKTRVSRRADALSTPGNRTPSTTLLSQPALPPDRTDANQREDARRNQRPEKKVVTDRDEVQPRNPEQRFVEQRDRCTEHTDCTQRDEELLEAGFLSTGIPDVDLCRPFPGQLAGTDMSAARSRSSISSHDITSFLVRPPSWRSVDRNCIVRRLSTVSCDTSKCTPNELKVNDIYIL